MNNKQAAREAYWRALWQKRDWRACLLFPLSILFVAIAKIRRAVLRRHAAPVPVVVVGGIMIGGVGKTPVVVSLARALQQAGFHPAIISRGYAAQKNALPMAVTASSLPTEVGDEPILLALKTGCPVWVGRNRVAVAKAVCAAHPQCDVVICDDGLQHYALQREIEIVVMDERGVGNGWCLPAGPLRETPARLAEADAVVWHYRGTNPTRTVDAPNHFVVRSAVTDAYELSDVDSRRPLSFFAGQSVCAFAGIAQPEVFFNMLAQHGIAAHALPLPDHFQFDAAFFAQDAIINADYVLMTEKDAVKVKHLVKDTQKFMVVPLELEHNPDLAQFLIHRLKAIS